MDDPFLSSSIEDATSYQLYRSRSINDHGGQQQHRQLKKHHHHHHDSDKNHPKVAKNHPPPVGAKTQHGVMIDAGSQGTRLHVYEFEARILEHRHEFENAIAGRKLSFPTTDTRWTNRLQPGLDAFAYMEDYEKMMHEIEKYLQPLWDFAKLVMEAKQKQWSKYPIFLKATGGLRSLPRPYRIRLMSAVRSLMHNKTFNPFFFEDEHARVISGEEEAIYGWAAVNFVMGTLIKNSEGTGTVSANHTYGVLEMGGASTQIGFFEPQGDVMANLFKLQIGAAKHWNVYAHSFLYFGVEEAMDRLSARLYTRTLEHDPNATKIINPCLPGRSEHLLQTRVHMLPDGSLLPLSSPDNSSIIEADLYTIDMHNPNSHGDFDACLKEVHSLLRKEANSWCNFAHDRDCSLAGIYQPPLPIDKKDFGEFIATSNFFHIWDFVGLKSRSTLKQFRDATRLVCSFSEDELLAYNLKRDNPITDPKELKVQCFRATFAGAFLMEGAGFPENYSLTALTILNGQKVGWALGSMLYEINTLPWEFSATKYHKMVSLALWTGETEASSSIFAVILGSLLLVILATGLFVTSYRFLFSHKLGKHVDSASSTSMLDQEPLIGAGKQPKSSYGASH